MKVCVHIAQKIKVYKLQQMEYVMSQNSHEDHSIQELYLLNGFMLSLETKEGFVPLNLLSTR